MDAGQFLRNRISKLTEMSVTASSLWTVIPQDPVLINMTRETPLEMAKETHKSNRDSTPDAAPQGSPDRENFSAVANELGLGFLPPATRPSVTEAWRPPESKHTPRQVFRMQSKSLT